MPDICGMADDAQIEAAQLQVVLERVDPAMNLSRYYVVSIEPTLFAENTVVRRWGRIGSWGRQRLEFTDTAGEARQALETWLARKRKRGYTFK